MKPFFTPLVLCIILLFNIAAASEGQSALKEQVGDMSFQYTPGGGVDLSLFDVPIISGSTLVLVPPGWGEYYYFPAHYPQMLEKASVTPFKQGKKIVIRHGLDSKDPFLKGTETYTLLPDHTILIDLQFEILKEKPAIFEWKVGGISPLPIIGMPYTAVMKENTSRGTIFLDAPGKGIEECMVAKGFQTLKIESRLGTMEFHAKHEDQASFFDYRKNKWAERSKPIFWFGFIERPVKKGKKYSRSLSIKLPASPENMKKSEDKISVSLPPVKVNDALEPAMPKDYIIPTPKKLKFTSSRFPLSSKTEIYVGRNPDKTLEKALDYFLRELEIRCSIHPQIIRDEPTQESPVGPAIVIGERGRWGMPQALCEDRGLKCPENEEGYCLFVDRSRVALTANNPRGIFYGLNTLLQLVCPGKKGLYLKGATVVDYPALPFRGIHCLAGKKAGDQISKAVRTLMARFKINTLVWECEYIIWDCHPEIAHPEYGMKKEEAAKVIKAAGDHFIELIPLVQSLGHSEWVFQNNKNLDLAEDPDTPYATCPTNPKTYEFLFSVYQEALDFFHPKVFHIGHDEVTMRGRFPWRSRSKGKSTTDLILEDIHKLHDWFAKRSVRIMLWGDMFLWKEEATGAAFAPSAEQARIRRKGLPPDVFIADWHYDVSPPEKFRSLDIFRKEGFQTVGASWYLPENIANLAKACVLFKTDGLLQTTWAGFNFKIDDNEQAWFQYWAYIWAAQYSWTGENTPLSELPFDARKVFFDAWNEKKVVPGKQKGFLVNLDPICNISLSDNTNHTGWLGYGPELDLSSFPRESNRLEGKRFRVGLNEKGKSALLLDGRLNRGKKYPREAEIALLGNRARELHFLLTAAFKSKYGTEAGEIEINFNEGSKERIKLLYGKNIFSFIDPEFGSGAEIVWSGASRSGQLICLHDVSWKNPHPEKEFKSLTIRSSGGVSAPILLAVTGVE